MALETSSYSCLSLPAPVKPQLNSTTSLGNGKDISPWNGQVGKKRKKNLSSSWYFD